MTVQTALLQGTRLLEDAGVAVPRLTAEVLLSHALGRERVYLYAHPEQELREVEWIHYGRYLHERMQGKPTQYITRRQEFYGREFRVTPDVLIPRPETEHVVEVALRLAGGARRILDVGAGSGALAVTLQLETGAATWATDISPAAAAVAGRECAPPECPHGDRDLRPDGSDRPRDHGPDRFQSAVRSAHRPRRIAARSPRLGAAHRPVRRRERLRDLRPDRRRRSPRAPSRGLADSGTGLRQPRSRHRTACGVARRSHRAGPGGHPPRDRGARR